MSIFSYLSQNKDNIKAKLVWYDNKNEAYYIMNIYVILFFKKIKEMVKIHKIKGEKIEMCFPSCRYLSTKTRLVGGEISLMNKIRIIYK